MYAALDRKCAKRLNPFRKVGAFRSFNALNSIPTEIKQNHELMDEYECVTLPNGNTNV